jgi:hypothetical protein
MATTPNEKYGQFSVVRGGRYGRQALRTRTTGEFRLDDAMHTAFCQLTTLAGTVPSRGVQEVRERKQFPWRILARRIVEARMQEVPKERVRAVIHALEEFLEAQYEDDGPARAA